MRVNIRKMNDTYTYLIRWLLRRRRRRLLLLRRWLLRRGPNPGSISPVRGQNRGPLLRNLSYVFSTNLFYKGDCAPHPFYIYTHMLKNFISNNIIYNNYLLFTLDYLH